jgi:plastocyanin
MRRYLLTSVRLFSGGIWVTAGALLVSVSALAGSLQVTVLDKNGKPTPDAVVVLVPEGKGAPKNLPPLNAVVNQEKMQFVPAVTVVSAGAKVRFSNSDPWDHQVRLSTPGLALPGRVAAGATVDGISLRLEGKTEGRPAKFADVTLEKTGAFGASILSCAIHGSMSGHVYVAESPWTLKTDSDGIALLEDVPEGSVTVKVWHAIQYVEPAPQKIAVGATPGKMTVQLDIVPRRRRL